MSDLNEAVKQAVSEATTPEAIMAAIAAEASNQKLVRNADGAYVLDPAAEKAAADKAVADKAAADAAAAKNAVVNAEPMIYTRTETINGRDFVFEAPSELELERQVNTALRTAYELNQQQEEVVETDEQIDPAKQAADRAELELQFKNGQIDAKTYLEKSGAIDDYLSERGVPVEKLKETIEQGDDARFVQSWESATQEFLNSSAGADWPGGERNRTLIGLKIAELGLTDADDKVAALAQAYQAMKSTGMIFTESVVNQNADADKAAADAAAAKAAADATTAAAVAAAARSTASATVTAPPATRTSSSVFGASSGTSANNQRDTSAAPQTVVIPKEATPDQIIAAWKESLLKAGVDPNAAFTETFIGRR